MKGDAPFMPRGPVFMLDTMWAGAGGPPNPALLAREAYIDMMRTAQNAADRYELTREEIDAFALRSHQHAAAARDSGASREGDAPGRDPGHPQAGGTHLRARREHPRRQHRGEARGAREAELTYGGKETRGSVLAGTMAAPFAGAQAIRRPGRGPADQLIFGDNLQVLKRLLEEKDRGRPRNADGSDGVRLCHIDPPFATRREFRGRRGAPAYHDKVEGAGRVAHAESPCARS